MDNYELQEEESLPPRWSSATVEEIGEVVTGFTPPKSEARFFGGSIPLFKPTDLDSGYFVTAFRDSLTEEGARLGRLLPPLSVLVTCIGATIGKTGLTRVRSATNQQINAVVVDQRGVLPQWLYWGFKSPAGQRQIIDNASATTLPILNKSRFQKLRIAVAPYEEQGRIVKEIEKQFSRLDAAVEALKRVRANLKRYRASVLKAACEGRLVPTEAQLANAGGRDYEPADALLQRVFKARRANWEAGALAKIEAKPKAPKDDRWRAKYTAATSPGTESLPTLPDGWAWASVEQLASLTPNSITDGPFGSNLKTAHYTESGPRVIRLQNIGDGFFVDAQAHISSQHFAFLVKHRVHAGDLVIAALGERPPRACVIPSSVGPAIVKADCVRFKPNDELALSAYLTYALNSDGTRTRTAAIVHGVGRPRLNLGEIKSIALPLPPLDEQRRIVTEVERRLSVIEEIKAPVEANLKRAERLRQSILKQAFEGKLVPQDQTDEPASVLLERIRAERKARVEHAESREGGKRMKRKRA